MVRDRASKFFFTSKQWWLGRRSIPTTVTSQQRTFATSYHVMMEWPSYDNFLMTAWLFMSAKPSSAVTHKCWHYHGTGANRKVVYIVRCP